MNDSEIDNPDNYVIGIFYFNKKDKRVVVPKRNRLRGSTLNFASPYAYLLLIGLLAVGYFIGVTFRK